MKGIKVPKLKTPGKRGPQHRGSHTIDPVENAVAQRERRKRDAIRS